MPVKEIVFGLFLAVFFLVGFGAGSILTQTSKDSVKKPSSKVSMEKAVSNGEKYLTQGPLSYPFTYNLTTRNIEEVEIGNTKMYNWTVSYVVEANPFQGPTYNVPGNQTKATKTMNLYITTDGQYIFPSQPIQITQ